MKNFITLACVLFFFGNITAQVSEPAILQNLKQPGSAGKIEIIEDTNIVNFLSDLIGKNAETETMPGYRIVVFRETSNKAIDNAEKARSKIISNFPELTAYRIIKSPTVWVYAGDFRTLSDALRMKKQLQPLFSTARIVATEIDIKKLNR